jgi:hypothetical protein
MVRTRVVARLALTLILMLSLSVSLAWATGKTATKKSTHKATAAPTQAQAQTPAAPHQDKSEKTLTKAQVPTPVISAFNKDYPGANPVAYTRKTTNGNVHYDIANKDKDGHVMRHVIYTPAGTQIEMMEAINTADLPAVVQSTVSTQYADQKVVNSEKITRNNATEYEVVVSDGKQLTAVTLDDKGTVMKTEKESLPATAMNPVASPATSTAAKK